MPKSIGGSVGAGGRNLSPDVVTVQYLLNCVPSGTGGPFPELVVDGLAGPKTIAAIRRFQNTVIGHADGRVDPGGRTIQALLGYDPYPYQVIPLPNASGKTPAASPGKGFPGQKTPPDMGWGKSSFGAPGGKSGSGEPWGKGMGGKSGGGGKSAF